jgi:hypothetical protein
MVVAVMVVAAGGGASGGGGVCNGCGDGGCWPSCRGFLQVLETRHAGEVLSKF